MKNRSLRSTVFMCIIAMLVWFALIAQFYLQMQHEHASKGELVIRYFTYYTILTNLLIAICLTILLLMPISKWASFFNRQQTLAASTVYILVVGLVYNLVLRSIWAPTGTQKLVDELLHLIGPILFFLFWLFFVGKHQLRWKHLLPWLIYPFVYCIIVLLRGPSSHFYPYPFMDIDKLGMQRVLVNCLAVTGLFAAIGLAIIGIGKRMART